MNIKARVVKDNLDLLPFRGCRLRAEHQVEFFYNLHPTADTAIVPGARLKVIF